MYIQTWLFIVMLLLAYGLGFFIGSNSKED